MFSRNGLAIVVDNFGELKYIHGSGPTSDYLALDASFKNPAIASESKGLKATISANATWNGQTMERTELIPQTVGPSF